MKILLFCCMEEKKWDTIPKSEWDKIINKTMVLYEKLQKIGQLFLPNPPEPVGMAIPVRVHDDAVALTSGPLAETKEQNRGFFLIEARDINQAVQITSKFPSVRLGSREVRPVRELPRQGIEAEYCQDEWIFMRNNENGENPYGHS
ncbi:MAG TPA: YciI family protein [Nitrospirales bacterium]|nr:YciI family protein [Nitrospirales bacterium]